LKIAASVKSDTCEGRLPAWLNVSKFKIKCRIPLRADLENFKFMLHKLL